MRRLFLGFFPNVFGKFQEPARPTPRSRSRKLPLHTCAVSILSSTHRAYSRAQELGGPSGFLFRKSTRLASLIEPYAREIQNRCLSILTIADDQILAGECAIERCFPASALVFDVIDGLVRAVEVFPEKAERIIATLPVLIDKVPFLNRPLSYVLSGSDPWVSGPKPEIVAWEKDIQMDMRSTHTRVPAGDEEAGQELFSLAESLAIETKTDNGCKEVLLEKGNREGDHQGQELPAEYDIDKEEEDPEEEKTRTEEGLMNEDDSILDLFDTGWHMNNKAVKQEIGSPVGQAGPGAN